jgi:hypothetical protein
LRYFANPLPDFEHPIMRIKARKFCLYCKILFYFFVGWPCCPQAVPARWDAGAGREKRTGHELYSPCVVDKLERRLDGDEGRAPKALSGFQLKG